LVREAFNGGNEEALPMDVPFLLSKAQMSRIEIRSWSGSFPTQKRTIAIRPLAA
jgi:hypothetical protein